MLHDLVFNNQYEDEEEGPHKNSKNLKKQNFIDAVVFPMPMIE